jgi:dTDP-4-amino-4,6-dideoxygalactose transaminase
MEKVKGHTMSRLALFGGSPARTKPTPTWPIFDDREETALLEVLRSGEWWRYSFGAGSGQADVTEDLSRSKVVEFQKAFAEMQGAKYGIACANGTGALEVALKALGIGAGDEVIVPAYSFIATASAVLMVNAMPIFVDIDEQTFNIDPQRVEEAITPKTKAMIPVHFAGQAADMDALLAIARRHGLVILEDAAHAHGATWNDRGLGTIGELGTFSFQSSKNMTAGEGGIILTNDQSLAALCESYIWGGREIGRPWYEHHRLGWNYRMTEFQGAILLQQLARLSEQNAKRERNAAYLSTHLSRIPGISVLTRPGFAKKHSHHIFIFRFQEREFGIPRKDFLRALENEGIACSSGYAHPLYKNPVFLNQNFYPKGCPFSCGHPAPTLDYNSFAELCPNAERGCAEAVWLQHWQLLEEKDDMDSIVEAISKIYECREELVRTPA